MDRRTYRRANIQTDGIIGLTPQLECALCRDTNHDDSKGKVARDDITLRANRCTKCHGNTIAHVHLIAHYVSGGEVFTGNYIPWQPPHSGIIFDPQTITARNAFVHKIWTLYLHPFHGYEGGVKISRWWPCAPDPWPFESKINGLRQTVEDCFCAKFQVIPIRGFRFTVLTHTNTPPHTLWQWS